MRGAFGFGCRSEATRWMHGVGMERKKETRRPSTPGIPKPPIRNAERRTDECSTSHLRFCFSRTVRQEYLPLQSCRAADPLRASCEGALPAVHLNANRTAKASSGSKQDGMVNKKQARWDVRRRLVCVRMRSARMERALAIACNVYVSEGKDRKVLQALEERAMRLGAAFCVQVFVDAAYHRTGYTFVAPWSRRERFADDVAAFSAYAVEHVDLRDHVAAHPRLGAVDHVLCAPIRPPHQDQDETWTAREVAVRVAEGLAKRTDVSVALYGDADAKKRSLADVRRALGYFKGANEGLWKGCPKWPDGAEEWLQYGPKTPPEKSGVTAVGACPWVVNYNVRMRTTELQKAAQVAKKVSARGGGMQGVQAMALPHKDGIEVACNLLMPDVAGPDDVQRRVEELGEEMGIPVDIGYVIGKSPQQLLEIALQRVQD